MYEIVANVNYPNTPISLHIIGLKKQRQSNRAKDPLPSVKHFSLLMVLGRLSYQKKTLLQTSVELVAAYAEIN